MLAALAFALLATPAGCPTATESESRASAALQAIDRVNAVLAAADERLLEAGIERPPPPFSLTRNRIVVSAAQAAEFARNGRIRVFEFGWPVLAEELSRYEREAGDLQALVATAASAARSRAESCWRDVLELRDRLRDGVDRSRFYVDRTRSWDGFCRTGPWLTDRSTKLELERRIATLAAGGEAEELRLKRIVYDHYYRLKRAERAVSLEHQDGGYCLDVRLVLWGPGASEAVRARVAQAVEQWWQGEIDGRRFVTRADVRIGRPEHHPDHHAIEVAAAGEVFMPSGTRFHQGVEPETIAHEVGHVLGFADRYRDLYDAGRGVYVNYLEDVQSLMAAQNLVAPVVTESDLRDLVRTYLEDQLDRASP